MTKKLYLWALTALFLCSVGMLTSCSSDNDEETPTQTPTEDPTSGDDAKRDRARYTVMIYGNAGGQMDSYIEGMWDKLKPMLDDTTNVRVFVMYKYGNAGEEFSGKYGQPADVMQFELTSKTDLTKLHETSAVQVPEYELYDSKALAAYIKAVREYAPADNYIFALWGHGSGYDVANDRPDNMVITRAMLYDEALEGKALNMYQFADALATCGTHFQYIMFHNCLMGNIETLTEVQQYADYFFASAHSLASAGQPITVMVDKLKNATDYNFEDRAKEMFVDLKPIFTAREGMPKEMADGMDHCDMDIKIIRSADLTNLNNNISFFVTRLLELYPSLSPEVMGQAMTGCAYTYEVQGSTFLIDLKRYLQTVAAAINDTELSAHAKNAIECLDSAIIQRWDEPKEFSQLKEYSLSVMLPYHDFLHYAVRGNYTVAESYYPSAFNRRTGWALWMDANTYFPTKWMFDSDMVPPGADMSWDMLKEEVLDRK